jgi:hypothetical protein
MIIRTLYTLVGSEAGSQERWTDTYVNAVLLKRRRLVYCLCPPCRLLEPVHPSEPR